jgi:hypothetical protein
MDERAELMDGIDAGVFSGDLLETHLLEFDFYVARWSKAIKEHKKMLNEENDA